MSLPLDPCLHFPFGSLPLPPPSLSTPLHFCPSLSFSPSLPFFTFLSLLFLLPPSSLLLLPSSPFFSSAFFPLPFLSSMSLLLCYSFLVFSFLSNISLFLSISLCFYLFLFVSICFSPSLHFVLLPRFFSYFFFVAHLHTKIIL